MISVKSAPSPYVADRPYASPKAAGQRLWHHAKAAMRLQTSEPDRVYVEQINSPFLFKDGASPAEYRAGIEWLIAEGCIAMHESGCFFVMHPRGHDLFADATA